MNGRPVWLASISRRDNDGDIIATDSWSRRERKRLTEYLRTEVLGNVGDATVERVFRMNVTLCIHRLCTASEVACVAPLWANEPKRALAGQPVEILEERGCVSSPSCRPCANPRHIVAIEDRPDLWVPGDCGSCESCRARASVEA